MNPDGLAVAVSASAEQVRPILDGLVAEGLAEIAAGAFRLTADGKLHAASRLCRPTPSPWGERRRRGRPRRRSSSLDQRMKETVTAWQLRDVGGDQTFNDHSDAAYDARVLAGLAALHADAAAWLAALAARLPRLAAYRMRLERALTPRPSWRPALRRLAAGRQLPQRLVRASRGPDPAGRPATG